MLFRLKDAARGAPNSPEWKRLFVQGVGNYLMGCASTGAQLDRGRAAELESFMDDNGTNLGRFVGRALTAAPNYAGAFREVFGKKDRDRMGELAAGEAITGEENAWLETHIHADGEVDEYEQALLKFLAEE